MNSPNQIIPIIYKLHIVEITWIKRAIMLFLIKGRLEVKTKMLYFIGIILIICFAQYSALHARLSSVYFSHLPLNLHSSVHYQQTEDSFACLSSPKIEIKAVKAFLIQVYQL